MIFTYLWLSDHFARFSVFASAVIVGAIFFVNIFINGCISNKRYYICIHLNDKQNEKQSTSIEGVFRIHNPN